MGNFIPAPLTPGQCSLGKGEKLSQGGGCRKMFTDAICGYVPNMLWFHWLLRLFMQSMDFNICPAHTDILAATQQLPGTRHTWPYFSKPRNNLDPVPAPGSLMSNKGQLKGSLMAVPLCLSETAIVYNYAHFLRSPQSLLINPLRDPIPLPSAEPYQTKCLLCRQVPPTRSPLVCKAEQTGGTGQWQRSRDLAQSDFSATAALGHPLSHAYKGRCCYAGLKAFWELVAVLSRETEQLNGRGPLRRARCFLAKKGGQWYFPSPSRQVALLKKRSRPRQCVNQRIIPVSKHGPG